MNRSAFLRLLGLSGGMLAMKKLTDLHALSQSLPLSERMPVLFLGHGSPMNAIEENQFVRGFRDAAKGLSKPAAVLCVSAHWYTRGTRVTAMEMPRTIHDFGGFPQELFNVQYPAPGQPELASEVAKMLQPTAVVEDHEWGLDHGAWSVIKHMYPDANIPVIQLSIDRTMAPEKHFELAAQLDALRDRGVLIVGSGNIVHNLRMIDWPNMNKAGHGYDWAHEARDWVNGALTSGNVRQLTDYSTAGQALQLAIPTPDHYLPLIYTVGLRKGDEKITLFNDELLGGSISMTSVRIG